MLKKIVCLLFVALMAGSAFGAYGYETSWVDNWVGGVSTDYQTGGNWDTGYVPDGDKLTNPPECKALIDNWDGSAYVTPANWPVISGDVPSIRELKISHNEAGDLGTGTYGELTMNSGYLYMDGDLEVGAIGTGVLYMNGGKIKVGDDCRINGKGTLNMTGGTLEAWSGEGLQFDQSVAAVGGPVVLISGGLIDATTIEWHSSATITVSGTGLIKLNGDVTAAQQAKIDGGQIIGAITWYNAGLDHTFIGVPEPATLALLGLGGFLIRRRRLS